MLVMKSKHVNMCEQRCTELGAACSGFMRTTLACTLLRGNLTIESKETAIERAASRPVGSCFTKGAHGIGMHIMDPLQKCHAS